MLITILVFFSIAISCDHVAMPWSWFLFVSMFFLGSLGSFFLCCHSLPSNLCGHINATAFFWCQSKTWINANVNILFALLMCDYACQWLFFSASVKLSVKSACFPGEDACWHRNVLSFLWSFVRRVFFVLWQHFFGFAFFPCTIRKVRGRPVAEGSLPHYRRDSRG